MLFCYFEKYMKQALRRLRTANAYANLWCLGLVKYGVVVTVEGETENQSYRPWYVVRVAW